jgi:hypothetical protein
MAGKAEKPVLLMSETVDDFIKTAKACLTKVDFLDVGMKCRNACNFLDSIGQYVVATDETNQCFAEAKTSIGELQEAVLKNTGPGQQQRDAIEAARQTAWSAIDRLTEALSRTRLSKIGEIMG